MYEPDDATLKRIANDFTYHAPIAGRGQTERYEVIREWGRAMAMKLTQLCPPSRELSLALTNLEQTVFWANAAIARHEQ